jgi:glutamyl/glutaminyl-tRNA synthetase
MRQNILFPKEAALWANILFGDKLDFSAENTAILKEAGDSFFICAHDAIKQHGIDLKLILDDLKSKLSINGKKLFMPLRLALTGEQHGPELIQIAQLLGHEKMLDRINEALECARK